LFTALFQVGSADQGNCVVEDGGSEKGCGHRQVCMPADAMEGLLCKDNVGKIAAMCGFEEGQRGKGDSGTGKGSQG